MNRSVAFGTLLILAASCADNGETMPEEGTLSATTLEKSVIVMEPGKEYRRTGFTLRVDSVKNDSRCPEDVVCIWAGNVEVDFNLRLRNRRLSFTLNTNSSLRRDTVIQGVRYALIDVSPYPRTDTPIRYEDYRVTVSVGE